MQVIIINLLTGIIASLIASLIIFIIKKITSAHKNDHPFGDR